MNQMEICNVVSVRLDMDLTIRVNALYAHKVASSVFNQLVQVSTNVNFAI